MKQRATILVIDDDRDVLTAARMLLKQHFELVLTTDDPAAIPDVMAAERVDVFLLDMNFAIGHNTGEEGLHWLRQILTQDADAVVVLMTAFGDLNTAVRAMREGASDFVLKPWQNDKLVATLGVAASLRRSRSTVAALSIPPPATDLIAESAAMQDVLRMVERVAPTDANVLVRGENGTGKEVIAQALHRLSTRAGKPLVAVDLGAVAESLFESELFGHRKGSFTDASSDRAGRFQAADGGTLFLDEVGNLPPASQTKLLRVLESREVTPLGSDRPVPIDVRLTAATNRPLEDMVGRGEFREDLLYRLNTIELRLPPLRERRDDILPLARHFAGIHARKYQRNDITLADDAQAALTAHDWPGNVRELSHAVERAVILSDGGTIGADDLELRRGASTKSAGAPASLNLEDNERRLVQQAIEEARGNVSHAAQALGITRAALYRRIEKFGL